MNEIGIRRELLEDPRHLSPEAREAIAASPALARLRDELLQNDERMGALLRQAPVPEGLADRIVLRARFGQRFSWRLAIAASVAAVSLTLPFIAGDRSLSVAERAMVAHVVSTTSEWDDRSGIEPALLRASVARLGVDVRIAGYGVRHLGNCVIDGREGRHFVLDTPKGPVAFVILPSPGESAGAQVMTTSGDTRAVLMKRAGLAIGAFTRSDVDSRALEALLNQVIG